MSHHKIIDYYRSTAIDYKVLWTGQEDRAMHYGYHDRPDQTHVEALLRMNEFLNSLVGISAEDHVLDAGCGYGGTAIWLGKTYGCHVTGINIVPPQVEEARRHAQKEGLTDKVIFAVQDYTRTDFKDQSFTVVWGLESIVHTDKKDRFIREAYRLLQPGGRLMIAEYMLRQDPPLSTQESEYIQPWLDGWAMPDLLTPAQYHTLLTQTGYTEINTHDLTDSIRPSAIRMQKLSRYGLPIASFLKRFGLFSRTHYGNVLAAHIQGEALKKGIWQYVALTAIK